MTRRIPGEGDCSTTGDKIASEPNARLTLRGRVSATCWTPRDRVVASHLDGLLAMTVLGFPHPPGPQDVRGPPVAGADAA